MGLFGKRPVKGITSDELNRKTFGSSSLKDRMHGVIKGYNKRDRDRTRGLLDNALGLVNDRDSNMPLHQKKGIIQPEEFEDVVGGLEKNKIISKDEAVRLRDVAKDALNN